MRILVVEDEAALQQQLVSALEQLGWAVDAANTGRDGLYMGNEYPIDLAILDLGLPDIDGLEIMRAWRAEGRSFPVLILTARGRWNEKVTGLEAGADDYLVKPFHIEEVLARVRALIRRAGGWANAVLKAGNIQLDTVAQQVTVDTTHVSLTAFEYRLLEYLMLHAGEVISKTTLADHIYAEDSDRDSNVLEVLIGRLRRKLDPDGVYQPIETLRGRGYRFGLERQAR
jgi:two-component system, OmpR family, response regulator PhoP